jgi:hypothetical protein
MPEPSETQMTRLHDLVGQRFGHLVLRERTPYRNRHGGVYWLCECDCRGNKEASTHSLRRGTTPSCGCLRTSKGGKCDVQGCTTRAYCKGLCFRHYQRARRHDGDTSDRPRITICTIEGCGGKVRTKGLCAEHYMRALHQGGGLRGGSLKSRTPPNPGETLTWCFPVEPADDHHPCAAAPAPPAATPRRPPHLR